jgi:zinc protease
MKRLYAALLIFCTCAHATLPITHFSTTEGTPVAFYQASEVPILDVSIAFYAGSAYEGRHFGLSALITDLIDQGNAGKTADVIANQFAEVGSQFSTQSERDYIALHTRTLNTPQALSQTIQTLSEVIGQPDFPETAFKQKKNQQLLRIRQNNESGDHIADRTFYQTLYGQHPYAHPIDGTQESVNALSLKDVQEFYNHFFVTKNAVIVLVGAIDIKEAHAIAEKLSHSLHKGPHAKLLPKPQALSEEMNIEVPLETTQTVIRLGQLGINAQSPDYFPLLVGNYILGGGNLVSQLAITLREKRGLTYGVYSQFVPLLAEGPFIISLSTEKTQKNTAEQLTRETLSEFIAKGPTNQELESAKKYLTGSFPLSIASNQSIAQLLLKMTLLDLPNNYLDTYTQHIESVTKTEIQAAFKRHIQPKKLINVQVGHP